MLPRRSIRPEPPRAAVAEEWPIRAVLARPRPAVRAVAHRAVVRAVPAAAPAEEPGAERAVAPRPGPMAPPPADPSPVAPEPDSAAAPARVVAPTPGPMARPVADPSPVAPGAALPVGSEQEAGSARVVGPRQDRSARPAAEWARCPGFRAGDPVADRVAFPRPNHPTTRSFSTPHRAMPLPDVPVPMVVGGRTLIQGNGAGRSARPLALTLTVRDC